MFFYFYFLTYEGNHVEKIVSHVYYKFQDEKTWESSDWVHE